MDTGADIFEIVALLEQFMTQQARSSTPVEHQSWGLVIDAASNADTVQALQRWLDREIGRIKGCTYRRVLRIAMAHVTEAATPSPAHAVVQH